MARDKRDREYRKIQKRRQRHYKFSDKTTPIQGILSFVLGIAALITGLAGSIYSYTQAGNAGLWVGAAGFIAMLTSIFGLILGLTCFRKREIHYFFPVTGSILCGIFAFAYLILYLMGVVA